jgi:hypothetical protein
MKKFTTFFNAISVGRNEKIKVYKSRNRKFVKTHKHFEKQEVRGAEGLSSAMYFNT